MSANNSAHTVSIHTPTVPRMEVIEFISSRFEPAQRRYQV